MPDLEAALKMLEDMPEYCSTHAERLARWKAIFRAYHGEPVKAEHKIEAGASVLDSSSGLSFEVICAWRKFAFLFTRDGPFVLRVADLSVDVAATPEPGDYVMTPAGVGFIFDRKVLNAVSDSYGVVDLGSRDLGWHVRQNITVLFKAEKRDEEAAANA